MSKYDKMLLAIECKIEDQEWFTLNKNPKFDLELVMKKFTKYELRVNMDLLKIQVRVAWATNFFKPQSLISSSFEVLSALIMYSILFEIPVSVQ